MAASLASADIADLKRRRLEQLQRQAAALGYRTPPETANEIQDLQRELAAAAPATVAESHDVLYALMLQINLKVDRLYWFVILVAMLVLLAVKL